MEARDLENGLIVGFRRYIYACALYALTAVALVYFCAGCGKSKNPADSKMVKVAYWGGTEEIAIIQDIIAEWQKRHPNIQVRLEHTPFSAYVSRLLTRIAGNVAPDIMAVEVNLFPSLWAKGAFLSLQPFVERDPDFDL